MSRLLHTQNEIEVAAPPDAVYELAADVLRWPRLLEHYRYVRLLHDEPAAPDVRTVEMGASRSGIPVSWTSIQRLDPFRHRITYAHIGGITKGMHVEWRITAIDGGARATIDHQLDSPRWWLRNALARYVAGRLFVMHIADRTLRGIKRHAEEKDPLK